MEDPPRKAAAALRRVLLPALAWLLTCASLPADSALIESTCAEDTDWNDGADVSDNLRLWIGSVKVREEGSGGGFAVNYYDEEERSRDESVLSSGFTTCIKRCLDCLTMFRPGEHVP